jgi:small ligand-binding sensory domain FIST
MSLLVPFPFPKLLAGSKDITTTPDQVQEICSGCCHQMAGQLYEDGISGVLLSSRIAVISGLTQGCTPMAARHTITRSDGKILAEIDGRPALDVFKEDIGEDLAKDLSQVADYIFLGLPVPGSDTGDYLVRDVMGIDPDEKLLMIGANLEDDVPVMFCRRDFIASNSGNVWDQSKNPFLLYSITTSCCQRM